MILTVVLPEGTLAAAMYLNSGPVSLGARSDTSPTISWRPPPAPTVVTWQRSRLLLAGDRQRLILSEDSANRASVPAIASEKSSSAPRWMPATLSQAEW